jgi:hypothetical protein
MSEDQEFEIAIYHNGVHFEAPTYGERRYLIEKEFLNNLVGRRYPAVALPRPVPDPSQDYYELDDEQLEAYSAFRRKMREA